MILNTNIQNQKDTITQNPVLSDGCTEKEVYSYIDTLNIFAKEIGKYQGMYFTGNSSILGFEFEKVKILYDEKRKVLMLLGDAHAAQFEDFHDFLTYSPDRDAQELELETNFMDDSIYYR